MDKNCRKELPHVVKGENNQDDFLVRSNALIQGRFFSVDTTILADKGAYYQYMRVKNSEVMLFNCDSQSNFSKVFAIQNTMQSMNYIFMVVKNKAECAKLTNAEI